MTAPTTTTAAVYATYRVLDEAYRAMVAQQALAVIGGMVVYWRSVDGRDLRRTAPDFLDRSVDLILAGQTRAQALATSYADRVRRIAIPGAPAFTPPPPRPPNEEQVRKSIEFLAVKQTGRELYALQRSLDTPEATPEEVESAQRTLAGRRDQLMQEGIKRAAGGATRLITLAGRDQLEDVVMADSVAIGWYRTTKPGCCYFCAMLASRGLVYKEDSFEFSNEQFEGAGEQKVHDFCGCGLRPAYSTDDELPDRTAEFEQMWIDSGRQRRPGETAINAFRRVYEGSPLAQMAG
jgi:hypothetical protein